MTSYLLLAGGLVLLIAGGELLVRGASRTAERLGMSPLLIGLTLVGFGTSSPELVTSVQASLAGSPGIAIGNIVGSNIANILLILGVAAMITPIAVREAALRRDGVLVLLTAIALAVIGFWLPLDRTVGAVFLLGLVAYLVYAYRQESAGAPAGHTSAYDRRAAHDEAFETPPAPAAAPVPAATSILIPLAMALAGLALVVGGGKLLVDGATGLARAIGISETVIGLTVVAIGTSLPEMVTTVVAALRRHSDVALGNVLGSNIYNTLGIGGVTALIAPTTIPPEIVRFDNLVMVGVSLLMLLVAYTGLTIARREGLVLVLGYIAYIAAIWPK